MSDAKRYDGVQALREDGGLYVLATDYDALLADLKKLGDPLALERLMQERDRYKAALRRIWFLDHNERDWESVEEVKTFARAALEAKP